MSPAPVTLESPAAPADLLGRMFPALPPDSLGEFIAAARVADYPALFTLCHEGEVERTFYVVLGGRVDVFKLLEGQRIFVNHLGPGEHFGDIALLLDLPRTATIVTAEPTRLFEIDRATFERFTHCHTEIVVALTRTVLRRFLAQEEKHLLEIARLKRSDAPQARVFLSYARADAAFANRLANQLLNQGIDVWLDTSRIEPGRSWARQIGEALDSCQILLLVLSPASVASENVEDEWNYCLDQKKPIVSALHQPCKVPYRLSKLQHVDFHTADYDQALARLLATLNTQL